MISQFIRFFTFYIPQKGLLFRLLGVLLFCVFIFQFDKEINYDYRFQLRDSETPNLASELTSEDLNDSIILIELTPKDFQKTNINALNQLLMINEQNELTDSYYWDKSFWVILTSKLLSFNPKSIGITLNFQNSFNQDFFSELENQILFNNKIYWSSEENQFFPYIIPNVNSPKNQFLSLIGAIKDSDGLIRKIDGSQNFPYLPEKIAQKKYPSNAPVFINYKRSKNHFLKIPLIKILNNEVDPRVFFNKIIIIGGRTGSDSDYLTPLGYYSKSELLTQIIANLEFNYWIKSSNTLHTILFLVLLIYFASMIYKAYSNMISIIIYFWVTLLIISLSIALFDHFNYWLPVLTSLVGLWLTWFVQFAFEASIVEKRNFLLEQEKRNLKELDRLKNNFISLISHDLKTPIAKIQGLVDRIEIKDQNNLLKNEIGSLKNSTSELNHYVKSIIQLLRVESSDIKINRLSTDINILIDSAVESLSSLALEKNITIQTQKDPLFSIEIDPILIKEAIINIIENAIKYSHANSHIEISSREENSNVIITVKDNGPGISEDDLKNIGKKFTRGKEQDLKTKGTGLGLYLVKYFIELHLGKLNIESVLGKGTTIEIILPLETKIN